MTQSTLIRDQLPAAYLDPAFMACVHQAVSTPELVEQFDRLYGADLSHRRTPIDQMVDAATGKKDSDIASFMRFVHDSIYMRVPDDAIAELRALATQAGITTADMGDFDPTEHNAN